MQMIGRNKGGVSFLPLPKEERQKSRQGKVQDMLTLVL